jgi:hypothetical protein
MSPQLMGSHRKTYEAIFRHPAAHNLQWRNVRSMLDVMAEIVQDPNGNLRVTPTGQTLLLPPPRHKDVAEVDELVEIRHFLERSGAPVPPLAAEGVHLLVVIDHRLARVYQTELHGAIPERIVPYDPHGFGRHLHNVQDDADGQRKPEVKSYYKAVAQALRDADKILVFGSGTGASSAMEQLLSELKHHHHELAERVVGTVALDEQHLTEDQLLARAREVYAKLPSPAPLPPVGDLGA